MSGRGHLLVTGGDGYLGRRVVRAALERDLCEDVLVWMRAQDAREFETKRAALESELRSFAGRVEFAWGDLEGDAPFAGLATERVTGIVHAAAVIRFNVEADLAERVNVSGTEKLLRFAETCRDLRALDLLSTLYASGLASGPIEERVADGRAGFANHYESSKAAAEQRVAAGFGHLPWRILRVATVLADDPSGATTQQNAVHNTLRLFFYGLLSVMPGERAIVPSFVTADFVADAWAAIHVRGAPHTVFHLAHRKRDGLALGTAIDSAFEVFERDPAFRARRALRPEFCDVGAFEMLAQSTGAYRGSVVGQALASVTPFARQLFVDKDPLNDNLRVALPDYRAPDAAAIWTRTCERLVATKWGRAPLASAS